jgi:HK97 gp10 family phage protein
MPTQVKGIVLDTRVLDKITAEMEPRAWSVINKYGWEIASEAAKLAPVDTGALRSSLLSESGFVSEDKLTFTIQDGVEYGIFQELGTSKMAAQPFLVPAVEAWTQRFLAAFSELFK